MPKRTSAAKPTPLRVVIVTLDRHLAAAVETARAELRRGLPGLELSLHAAAEWDKDAEALARCRDDIARGDIIVATMLFMENHIQAVLPDLQGRRDDCDALVACLSAGEVVRLTKLGRFEMGDGQGGAIGLLKRLRGSQKTGKSDGAHQMAVLRRLPKILRFIPGAAQDLRAYFLTMQYWLACSDRNLVNLVRFLIDRYAAGPREALRGSLSPAPPVDYPDTGLYHPALKARTSEWLEQLPVPKDCRGSVGLILMRSYVLAGDTGHYDGVIAALEARGLRVIPTFACGLDARPAVQKFFLSNGKPRVDAVVSLSGFSLVGGPAYNNAAAAEEMLAELDVPCLSAQALEFQTLDDWRESERGLLPVESTMMIAIPELDGATGPMVYGGRTAPENGARAMAADPERAGRLAERILKLIALRRTPAAERRIAITLFNFPPNAGAIGTAAHLAVFESLFNTLITLKQAGYTVEVPEDVEALREAILQGNAARFGADANVHARIPAEDHVRREPWLEEIEAQWGPAPGKQQSDGAAVFVLGAQFGQVFVGLQPSFGYEGDPMRLLFDKGFAPTHAFSAFYRYLREDFRAHAVLHFGTHGALEFMPGKQTGLSADCWPDRLIGDLPNFYLYAANNPSEGTIAKRRSAATLISYLTPPLQQAGLYKELLDLKGSIDRWRALSPEKDSERVRLAALIQAQAAALELTAAEPPWTGAGETEVAAVAESVVELEQTLIPHGLHVVGAIPDEAERADYLRAVAEASFGIELPEATLQALLTGASAEQAMAAGGVELGGQGLAAFRRLVDMSDLLAQDHETVALVRALDGRFVRPVPGGDLLRTPEILPTGRNLHGFDPFRIPSAFALEDGARQAGRLIARHIQDGNGFPESTALVLWGSDNLKTEGGPIGQALALMGARPRFDSYGRLTGASLIDLQDLGRPRIDVVLTLSGIFRDLLPLQTRLLAEAAFLAASAEEPLEQNFIRRNTLRYQDAHGCDFETAALRVFSNADGAYGSNVNHMIDSGRWEDEDDLSNVFTQRKCFAYGRAGKPIRQEGLLKDILGGVDLAYQNLESVELGVTSIDHYFDSLGGITRAVGKARGETVPVYIGDQTRGEGAVRTLGEQVAIETRTRMLNPAWYEGMLKHGYEGVRQIEAHVTNTLGWSATTGQVAPWVYKQLTETFILDEDMRARLASLNTKASARVANRLLEAQERAYWAPDADTLEALRRAGDELEDRLEGIEGEVAA